MVKRKKTVKKKAPKKKKKTKIVKKRPAKKTVKKTKKTVKKVVKKKISKKPVKKPKKVVKKAVVKQIKKPKVPAKKIKIGFFQQIINKFKKKEEETDNVGIPHVKPVAKTIVVEEIMTRNPVSIDHEEPIVNGFELIEKYSLPSLIVTKKGFPIGILNEHSILAFFSSFVNMEVGALETNKEKIEELSKKPVSTAMIRIEKWVKKTTPLEIAIKIMNSYDIDQLPVVFNEKLIGVLLTENILAFIEKSVGEHTVIRKEVFETGIDQLLDIINTNKVISSKEAAEELKINVAEIEKWARILQEHGLIEIDFSKVGTITLKKKERDVF